MPAGEEIQHKDCEIDAKCGVGAGSAVCLDDLLRHLEHLHHTDHQHQTGSLDHPGDKIDGQGDQPPHRLRDNNVPVGLHPAHAQCSAALVLVPGNSYEGAPHKVAHLRRTPQHKDDDGRRLPGKVPPECPGGAEVDQKQQHHLRHDADELQIQPQHRFQQRIAQGHQHAQQDAHRQTDKHRRGTDLQRHPKTTQQADHVFALEQDLKTQIRHSAASFPAGCPQWTPAAR